MPISNISNALSTIDSPRGMVISCIHILISDTSCITYDNTTTTNNNINDGNLSNTYNATEYD